MRVFAFFILLFAFASAAFAQTKVVRLEGQVVCCAECWAEADRTKVEFGTAEDRLKAKGCVEGGDPTLLAVREGDGFKLYRLEQGKFKLPGKNWLEFVGRRVAVSGAALTKRGEAVFRVDSLDVVEKSLAEREAANVVGQTIELKLRDLSGTEQNLNSYKGRIVVLNFWATYCVPCRKEMPDLALIQNEYAALGVQVIGASTDPPADRAKVLQFVKETKVNFPIWTGAGVADTSRFGLGEALPGTVVIDKEGRIVRVISGVVDVADLRRQLDSLTAVAASEFQSPPADARERASVKQEPSRASSVPS